MKEKTKLRVIQMLCIVSLLITVFSIQKTYAKYYEKIDTTYVTTIKRWIINVNNSNIRQNTTLNEIMTPVFRQNEHMNNNNTLVPGREGYFEFLIDYSNVDVKFRYEFDIEQLNSIPLTDFQIYGYSIVEDETETKTMLSEPNKVSEIKQVIDPDNSEDFNSNNEKKRKIRVLFRWYDGEDNSMNNINDTLFAGEENDEDSIHDLLKYKVKITFTQQL